MSAVPGIIETIDYDAVARSYREGLVTRLRGFRVGPEFLDAWVDDEDAVKALLDMFDAARGHGLPALRVVLSPETFAQLDRARLERGLQHMGRVAVPGATTFEVHFEARTDSASGESRPEVVTSRANDHVEDARRDVAQDGPLTWTLHELYAAATAACARDRAHEGPLAPDDAHALATAAVGDVTLRARIDPRDHRVVDARYEGAADDTQRGLLEKLCATLEGSSLREGSDHAVIRVEHALRDRSRPRPVAGIVLPENASPAFRPLLALTRGLLADYRRQGHDPGSANFDAPSPSPAWAALDADAQRDAVQRALDAMGVAESRPSDAVTCLRVAQGERVILAFGDAIAREARPPLLMRLEAGLKARVEPTLHVYLEERKDANKLRRL